jgi:AAA domain
MPIEIVSGDAAYANVVGLPANVLLYGPPGIGKTTDAVTAFTHDGRCSAFMIYCEDGALKSVAARKLPIPGHTKYPVKSWGAMVEAIAWLGQNRDKFNALIIDGFSTFAADLYKAASEQFKGKNKYDIPNAVRTCLVQLREWVRLLGLHSVFVGHPLPPVTLDGTFYQGSFALSPKTIVRDFFGQLDTVLRVDWVVPLGRPPIRVYYTGGEIWPTELGAPPVDVRQWMVKNREGVNQAVVPADLATFLRARQPPYVGL